MEVKEIFSNVRCHMIKGLMFHNQMARYYLFLNLRGYSKEQEHHYLSESKSLYRLDRHYADCYNALIPDAPAESPKVIPDGWHNHLRKDVDNRTKRTAVKEGLEKWAAWEKDAIKMYSDMVKELEDVGERVSADFILRLAAGAEDEEKEARRRWITLNDTDWNMRYILDEQRRL